jgi:hypothetical protein
VYMLKPKATLISKCRHSAQSDPIKHQPFRFPFRITSISLLSFLEHSRTIHTMPFHHRKHRHHDDDLPSYRRSDDEAKPCAALTPRPSPHPPPQAPTAACSSSSRVPASSSLPPHSHSPYPPTGAHRHRSRRPLPAFRCGRAEDSLHSFIASASPPHRNHSAGDREKVLAVVGVHTELGSTARRAALRSTWFPPNPKGIVRFRTLPKSCAGSSISDA